MRADDEFYGAVVGLLGWLAGIFDVIALLHYAIGDAACLGWLCFGVVASLLAAVLHGH